MKNNFQSNGKGRNQRVWQLLISMLFILSMGIGQMWGATALNDLNFSGITAAPSAYTYSSSNTPSYQSSQGPSGDKRPCMLVGNGGKGQTPTITSTGPTASTGKRWMAFCPAEDCDVAIVCTGNGKIFKLFDANHNIAGGNVDTISVYLSSYTGTSSWTTWNVKGLKAGTWYVLSASSSSSYVTSMQFTAKKYWLAFDANGHGTAPDTIKSLKKDSIIPAGSKPADPTASNYNFGGWYSNAACTGNAWVWGTSKVTQDTTLYAKWTPAGGTQSAIEYTYTKSATPASTLPTTYYEGTGIASFPALNDVTDFHFTGWSPASISTTATGKQTIEAQWVAAYDVTFSAGAGSGTVPASFQKWEGAKFNLPGQGSMTAPAGKAFDGWKANGAGDKLAADAEYTMGNAAVEFVAQWKALPQTIYYWQSSYSGNPTMNSAVNVTGGTIEWKTDDNSKSWANESYNKGSNVVPADLQVASGKKAVKSGGNALYAELTLAGTATFQEGDTIYVGGYKKWMFSTTKQRYDGTSPSDDPTKPMSGDIALVTTGSSNSSYDDGYAVIPAGVNVSTMYLIRGEGASSSIAAIKVVRPAERPISSTTITLSDVKVNNRSISSDSLTTLVSAKSLLLKDEYAVAPVIKFNEHKVITYSDGESPATKTTNKVYTVTATTVEGKWQASQTINEVAYTVTATKVSSAKVYYYDGSTKLGEETVAINGNPAEYADYQSKDLSSFVGWYDNSGLTGDAVTIASATITKDTTFYGKWNPVYAQSANLEQWVLDYGKTYDAWAQLGALGYSGSFTNSLDSLDDDPSKTNRNYAYLGFKVKNESGKQINFRVANGNTVKIKFGNVTTTPKVQYNNTGDYADMPITEGVYSYTADGADAYISIKAADNATLIFKQIMIGADPTFADVTLPWRVTYDANGGTCATAEAIWSGSALTLPAVTAPTDYTFAGWYDGENLAGAAGANYNATKNVTLQAHFAPVEYAIAYDGNGETSGSMSAGVAGWGTMVTPDANAFVKTGHVFSGWVITKTSDGLATGITFSEGKFEMPKYDVTLVAQWEDNSKVAVVVETSAKYESLAAAIAATEAGQTVQLIQDITQEEAILIDKNLTLDMNNKTFTVTNPSSEYSNRAIKVTAGTIVIENGTVDALSNETHDGGCWGSLRQEGGHLTCNNVTFKNYRSGGLGLKPVGGTLILNECTVLSEFGGGLELGNATVEVNNCTFTQTGTDAQKIYGACFGMGKMGTLTINGGTYTSDNYSFYIYTSGGTINVNSGTFAGDIKTEMNNTQYPSAVGTINISGGTFDGVGENPIVFTAVTANDHISISGGVFDAPIENQYCAEGYVPQDNGDGTYGVTPKDGVEIIGVVVTGNTEGTVSGIYKGTASIKLNNKKLDNGDYYIYVTLKEGYTFEENDVLIVDVNGKSDLSGGNKALEITTGVGNIDGAVWKSIAVDDYTIGENTISLAGIAAGQTSIGLKRSTNQNAKINGLRVLRPMNPVLKKVTVAGVEGTPDNTNHVAIEVPASTADAVLDAIAFDWVSNDDAWTAANAPAVANTWAWGVENTVTLTDKDGDASVYYVTISKAVPSSDATLATLTYGTPATAIALADGVFEYNVELPYGTSAVPTLAATAHHAGANVTDIDDADAFVNRHATSTVTVTAEDGTTTQLYTVNFTVSRFESKVLWDGSTMSALSDITAAATAAGVAVTTTGVSVTSFSAVTCEENGKSYTKALDFGGNTKSTRYFGIEIPAGKVAKVSLVYKARGTGARSIIVGTALASVVDESAITVVACEGDATYLHIMTADMFGGGTLYINTTDGFHVHEISLQLADGFARSSMLGNGVLGTICVPNNVAVEDIQGVTVYELMGRENQYGKLAFDEIVSGELEAGVPYVFQANGNHMAMLYGETHVENPVDKHNGMYGTFTEQTLTDLDDVYYFAQRALWSCDDLTSLNLPANRAYVKLSEINYLTDPNPAPGRRRITMEVNGEKVATDINNVQSDDVQCTKVMIDGQMYILRGEKMYDATGRLVK